LLNITRGETSKIYGAWSLLQFSTVLKHYSFFCETWHVGNFHNSFFCQFPNPLFDFAGMLCGKLGVPFWKFFLATLIGKAIIKVSIQVRQICWYNLLYNSILLCFVIIVSYRFRIIFVKQTNSILQITFVDYISDYSLQQPTSWFGGEMGYMGIGQCPWSGIRPSLFSCQAEDRKG